MTNLLIPNKEISDEEFQMARDFLQSRCGLFLGDNKKYLVQTRLDRLLRENGLDSYAGLIRLAERDSGGELLEKIIDKMTTHETFWFRDGYPFTILEELILPELLNREKKGPLRIWSCAASTGQEPYSIAMMVMEFCRKNQAMIDNRQLTIGNFEILATDISPAAIEASSKGRYDSFDIARGLSEVLLHRYFKKDGNAWEVREELKKMVHFRSFNLQKTFGHHGKFDVIFCRNVMIYFSVDFKKELMAKFKDSLHDRGFLFLGMSESPFGISNAFESVVHKNGVVFRKA